MDGTEQLLHLMMGLGLPQVRDYSSKTKLQSFKDLCLIIDTSDEQIIILKIFMLLLENISFFFWRKENYLTLLSFLPLRVA